MSKRFFTHWFPVLFWLLLIFVLSSIGGKQFPDIGFGFPGLDKIAHFGIYAILAFLLWRALAGRFRYPLIISFVVATLYGVTDELHQHFTPERFPDIYDWVADTAGAAASVIFIAFYQRFFRHEKTH